MFVVPGLDWFADKNIALYVGVDLCKGFWRKVFSYIEQNVGAFLVYAGFLNYLSDVVIVLVPFVVKAVQQEAYVVAVTHAAEVIHNTMKIVPGTKTCTLEVL